MRLGIDRRSEPSVGPGLREERIPGELGAWVRRAVDAPVGAGIVGADAAWLRALILVEERKPDQGEDAGPLIHLTQIGCLDLLGIFDLDTKLVSVPTLCYTPA